MPALTVTQSWQSRTTTDAEVWQVWEGVLQVDTESVEANRLGIRLTGGNVMGCSVYVPASTTVYYRAMNGLPCIVGYIPQ